MEGRPIARALMPAARDRACLGRWRHTVAARCAPRPRDGRRICRFRTRRRTSGTPAGQRSGNCHRFFAPVGFVRPGHGAFATCTHELPYPLPPPPLHHIATNPVVRPRLRLKAERKIPLAGIALPRGICVGRCCLHLGVGAILQRRGGLFVLRGQLAGSMTRV